MDGQKPQPYRKPKKMYMVSLDDRRVKVNSGITSVGESRMLMKSKCSEKQSKGRRRNVWNDSMVKATMGPLVMKQQSKEWVEWLSAKESEIDRVCQKDFKMQRDLFIDNLAGEYNFNLLNFSYNYFRSCMA